MKTDGRIMLMDYHFGPHPFPTGWVWKFLVTLMEISAGREHFANYREFISRQGLKSLIAADRCKMILKTRRSCCKVQMRG